MSPALYTSLEDELDISLVDVVFMEDEQFDRSSVSSGFGGNVENISQQASECRFAG